MAKTTKAAAQTAAKTDNAAFLAEFKANTAKIYLLSRDFLLLEKQTLEVTDSDKLAAAKDKGAQIVALSAELAETLKKG